MKTENHKKGFTLLELMVVLAIISIMSVTVVVSFSGLTEKIKLQETVAQILDQLKRLETEVFQKDYSKHRVKFEAQMLVVESEKDENSLKMSFGGVGQNGCAEGKTALLIDPLTNNPTGVVKLIKRDDKGNNLEFKAFKSQTTECLDFQESKEQEWSFQSVTPTLNSPTIRLIHFTQDRENKSDSITLKGQQGYELEIASPYGKKNYSKEGVGVEGPIEFMLQNQDGKEEPLILQK